MMLQRKKKKAFSTIEYLILLVMLTTAFFTFKDYILRGFMGRWKGVSDQFGYGRQFNPTDTVECAYDSMSADRLYNASTNTWYDVTSSNRWYDVICVENKGCPFNNPSCERIAILNCLSDFCVNGG